ncbi:MAG: nucleotidyltransferase [Nitrospirae bacterium]|nr:nucleotidyltransferase [Nitrospirota bacterium]
MAEGDLLRIFGALERARVRYLVVGGVAVVLHGHPRFTADLDLFIDLEPGNVRPALHALAGLGFRPRLPVSADEFADPGKRRQWIAEKSLRVFSLWSPDMPVTEVDLFVEEPFPFDAAYSRGVPVKIGKVALKVMGLEDLITLKREAGRPQDLADLDALEEIFRLRRNAPDD